MVHERLKKFQGNSSLPALYLRTYNILYRLWSPTACIAKAKKIRHGPFRYWLCFENMDFPALETQMENYSLSGFAPSPL